MHNLRLMLRMLRRDWRAGDLTVLGLALVVAVASLSSVSFLTDRVGQALIQESHQLLGGDLLLTADHPWADKFRREAAARGLRQAESATFPSMVSLGGAPTTQLRGLRFTTASCAPPIDDGSALFELDAGSWAGVNPWAANTSFCRAANS